MNMYAVYKLEPHNSQLMHQINEIYLKCWAAVCATDVFLYSRPTVRLVPRGCVSLPKGSPHHMAPLTCAGHPGRVPNSWAPLCPLSGPQI